MTKRRVLPAPVAPARRSPPGKPERAIYAVVRAIPRGHVATYGEVAELAGMPRGHRIVARAMRTCPGSLPWYRVVGKKDARRGQINIGDGEHAHVQRTRLEKEGVEFDENGFIPLRRFGMLTR
jgi:methylated-DNA-protein-cysteine methyltransferase-like protein